MAVALTSGLTNNQMLGLAALGGVGVVVAYGAYVELTLPSNEAKAYQISADKDYVLKYVDAQKALFKTPKGLTLVMVGSTLASAGRVESIEMRDDRWVVTTSKNLSFAKD